MAEIITLHEDGSEVMIPTWIKDNASFLKWAEAEEVPIHVTRCYLQGRVWVDQTMESAFHNYIKMAIALEVMQWVRDQELGKYYGDGMLFSCPQVQLSCEPDGMFVSTETQVTGKVWLEQGRDSHILFGSPDLVLEVVSRSSRKKDLILLRDLYHQASISEYWMVNSMDEEPALIILRRAAKGYVAVRPHDGWVKSQVLGASFRLVINDVDDAVRLERK